MTVRDERKLVRVLHVTFAMNFGGMESRIMDLYRNIDTEKIQFDFLENTIAEGAYDEEIRNLGGRIYYSGYSRKTMVRALKYIKEFFREQTDLKIIHIHESYLPSWNMVVVYFAKKYGKTIILHSRNAHGIHPLLHRLLRGRYSKQAEYHFACSELAAQWMFDRKTLESKNYEIIKNAINIKRFRYDPQLRAIERRKLGISDNEFVFGHIGRFYEQKNHKFLISAFEETAKEASGIKLILVGEGPLKIDIQKMVEEKGLSASVTFINATAKVEKLYQVFDMFLLPSLYEGFPGVGVEAQAAGLPCLFSDRITEEIKIIPELTSRISVDEGVDLWKECMLRARLEKKERRDTCEEMQKAGFNAATVALELMDFYEKVNKQ